MSNIVVSTNTQVIYEGETAYVLTYSGFTNTTSNSAPVINSIYVGITANNTTYVGNTLSSNVILLLETLEGAGFVNSMSLAANLANYLTIADFAHPNNAITPEDLDSGSF